MKEDCKHYIDTLGYLMEQTVIYLKERGEQVFKELNIGITLDQLIAMDTISANPGICQMDLSKLILKERSYTSRVLDSLEKSGLIERRMSKRNKRLINELYITTKGQDIRTKNRDKLKHLSDSVYKEMTEEEFEAIRNGILKMRECISKFTVMPL